MGDLLRDIIKSNSKSAIKIKQCMESGQLLDDETILDILIAEIKKDKYANGYILDGFPRTVNQAQRFDQLSKGMNRAINLVLFIDISKELAKTRVLGRLNCSVCGAIYHTSFFKDAEKLECQKCKQPLTKREDDINEATFDKRFDYYLQKTAPLIDYYKEQGLLYKIEGEKDIKGKFAEIVALIESKV